MIFGPLTHERMAAELRVARVARGLLQDDVAELADISTAFYGRLECAKARPSVPTMWRLTCVLGLNMTALLRRGVAVRVEPRDDPAPFPIARVGRRCRRAREEIALYQREAAAFFGLHVEYYARIERGAAVPSLDLMARLVIELEIEI